MDGKAQTTHWHGCWRSHLECAVARAAAAEAECERLRGEVIEANDLAVERLDECERLRRERDSLKSAERFAYEQAQALQTERDQAHAERDKWRAEYLKAIDERNTMTHRSERRARELESAESDLRFYRAELAEVRAERDRMREAIRAALPHVRMSRSITSGRDFKDEVDALIREMEHALATDKGGV